MPEFNELVEFMTSGPVRALGLTKGDTGEGVIELWRNIIGPFDPEEAKKESSDSIRVSLSFSSFMFSIIDFSIRLDMVPV